MASPLLKIACAAALCLASTACSGTFDRAWRQAAQPGADPFAGRWQGEWKSAKHPRAGGRLQCVLVPNGKNQYTAHFRANWMIFVSKYQTELHSERRGSRLVFHGAQDLGPLFGGVYRYAGTATGAEFHATYDSSYDRGNFHMKRPSNSR